MNAPAVEAEAARAWAATKLQDQTVELLKLRGQFERTTPGKSATDMLAALLAVQQERTGGATDCVVLWLDEAADLFRESGLFPARTREDVRAEIERLIRTGRKPYPTEAEGAERNVHRVTDLDRAASTVKWVAAELDAAAATETQEDQEQ